ncbi:MAG: DEAD/DEAH box helicase family protein [Alphaproteobacteria bacterium]|nr:DEAD/DEAH box helicase family protein [Alphaproteobacteria bacterium]
MNRLENTKSIITALPELIERDKSLPQPLKESQLSVLDAYMSDIEGHQSGIFNLATGFGKTRMMSTLMEAYLQANPNGRVVVVVPATDLIEDATGNGVLKSFREHHALFNSTSPLSIGAYYGFSKNTDSQVTVTTYNSLDKLQENIPVEDVGLLLLDEAHHGISDARMEIIRKFENAAQYGMTATPRYDKNRDLRRLLGATIADIPISAAIQEGDLVGCTNVLLVSNLEVDLSEVRKNSQGDYDEEDYYRALFKALGASEINTGNREGWQEAHRRIAQNVAQFYERMFNGQKCMINCRSQKEALIQAYELNQYFGRTVAKTYTSDYSDPAILKEFVEGDLPIICQVGKLAEGFDFPGLYYCINYPTCSPVKETQLGGRCLRKYSEDEFKEAIVVDIAFKHPKCENLFDAIQQNGQVLFKDIMGAPALQPLTPPKDGKGKGDKGKGLPRDIREYDGIQLPAFTIRSNPEELKRLMAEAEEIKRKRGIPLISEGMVAEEEFLEKYGLARSWGLDLLVKGKYDTFHDPETGKEEHFVSMVDTGSCIRMALTNNPHGIKLFEEKYHDILFAPDIKQGMLTARELAHRYNISLVKAKDLLEEWKDARYHHPKTNESEPMVYFVKDKGIPCLVLTNDPWGISIFEENAHLLASHMRPGMLTPSDVKRKYLTTPEDTRRIFEELEFKTFYDPISGTDKPFCEWATNVNGKRCLYLTDNPIGIKEFEKLYRKEIALPMTPGMLGAEQLAERYGLSEKICKKMLEELRDETFYTSTGEEELLVSYVKDPNNIDKPKFLALTTDPAGIKLFEKLKRDTLFMPEIQPGMKTVPELREKCANLILTNLFFQELFDKYEDRTYLDPVTGEEKKFIKTVKKDGEFVQVLTNDPLGIKIFEDENKRFLHAQKYWRGWSTADDMSWRYKIPEDVAQQLLEKYEGRTFVHPETQETLPVVALMYNKGRFFLALTPYRAGREIFEKENSDIITIRERTPYSPGQQGSRMHQMLAQSTPFATQKPSEAQPDYSVLKAIKDEPHQ